MPGFDDICKTCRDPRAFGIALFCFASRVIVLCLSARTTRNRVGAGPYDPDTLSSIMHSDQWRFEQLAKNFEALESGLKECPDAEQRKEKLQQMKAILNDVDELLTPTPKLNSTNHPQK